MSIDADLFRAQPDLAYQFSDRTGPDTQICKTGPAGPDWIRTYIFKHSTYQVWVINSHKIRSLDTNLVSKLNKQKEILKKKFGIFLKFVVIFLDFFFLLLKVLKVRRTGKKTSCFWTVRILKICRTSRPDVMSGRALDLLVL